MWNGDLYLSTVVTTAEAAAANTAAIENMTRDVERIPSVKHCCGNCRSSSSTVNN